MRVRVIAGLAVLAAAGLGGCTRAQERGAETNATTLTVYLSLPFQGAEGPESEATADGVRLALADAGGRAGEFIVKLSVLDNARPGGERWDPEQTAQNANTALRDRTTIAYLGDGPSGATAISLPILNAAGILQVSPSSGYTGLTQPADKGEPDKYYPSGVRSFARTIPADRQQVRLLRGLVGQADCRRLQLIDDGDVDSRGLTTAAGAQDTFGGARILDRVSLRPEEKLDPATEARKLLAERPDCVFVAAGPTQRFAGLLNALHAADPNLALFAGDDLATPEVAVELDPGVGRVLRVASPGGERSAEGVRIARRYAKAFGRPARPASLYGYDAMALVLAAIDKAGPKGNNRAAVERALFSVGERAGPFGRYRITPQGDVSEGSYVALTLRDGRLVPAADAGERAGARG